MAKKKSPAKKRPLKRKKSAAVKKPKAKKRTAKRSAPKKTSVKSKKVAVKKTTAKKSSIKKTKKKKPAVKKTLQKQMPVLLQVGDQSPTFELKNEKNDLVSSGSLLGKKFVLYFYPKDDTPGCTQESCDFRDSFSRIQSLGVQVFGISRDSVDSHVKFQQKYSLPFSLLSDEDGKICEAYGVWKEKNLYGREYMGIERTTFLVDENGKIAKVYPNVKVEGHVDQIMGDLAK